MLQKMLNFEQIPIKILLTGFSDIEILMDAVNKCNLFQYMLKPFDPEELQQVIENGLNKLLSTQLLRIKVLFLFLIFNLLLVSRILFLI